MLTSRRAGWLLVPAREPVFVGCTLLTLPGFQNSVLWPRVPPRTPRYMSPLHLQLLLARTVPYTLLVFTTLMESGVLVGRPVGYPTVQLMCRSRSVGVWGSWWHCRHTAPRACVDVTFPYRWLAAVTWLWSRARSVVSSLEGVTKHSPRVRLGSCAPSPAFFFF